MQPTAEQFTEKAWAAIVAAQQLAKTSRHQQLETEHLLITLLQQQGLAGRILNKAGADPSAFEADVETYLKRQPTMAAAPHSVFLGRSLNSLLDRAEEERLALTDSYISIEHLMLAVARDERCGRQLLRQAGLDVSKLREAIQAVRGSQTVTDQNPESTYESLQKYGRDLTSAARAWPSIPSSREIRAAAWPTSRFASLVIRWVVTIFKNL